MLEVNQTVYVNGESMAIVLFPDEDGAIVRELDDNSDTWFPNEALRVLSNDQGVVYEGANIFGTTGDAEYPTVIYSLNGRPGALSAYSFVSALRFAINARKWADEGTRPTLIFTDSGWSI